MKIYSDYQFIYSHVKWQPLDELTGPWEISTKFHTIIFKLTSVFDGLSISSEIELGWLSLDLTDDKSTLD